MVAYAFLSGGRVVVAICIVVPTPEHITQVNHNMCQ